MPQKPKIVCANSSLEQFDEAVQGSIGREEDTTPREPEEEPVEDGKESE
jgi:hypothetical protein